MVMYSFKPNFEAPILAKIKTQTIRTERKNGHAKPGDTLHLYVGARTKHARLFALATCAGVTPIEFSFKGHGGAAFDGMRIGESPWRKSHNSLNAFAVMDGFENWEALKKWFLDVHGRAGRYVLITWYDAKAPADV